MKSIIFILILIATTISDQIYTFDKGLPENTVVNGNVKLIDEAMGKGLYIARNDSSNVTIKDVFLPDTFTMVLWYRPSIKWHKSRYIIESEYFKIRHTHTAFYAEISLYGDTYFTINGNDVMKILTYKEGEKLFNEKYWLMIVWKKYNIKESFGAKSTSVDSVYMNEKLIYAKTYKNHGFDAKKMDFKIGTFVEGKELDHVYLDHLCIFNTLATKEDITNIKSIYKVDETYIKPYTKNILKKVYHNDINDRLLINGRKKSFNSISRSLFNNIYISY